MRYTELSNEAMGFNTIILNYFDRKLIVLIVKMFSGQNESYDWADYFTIKTAISIAFQMFIVGT